MEETSALTHFARQAHAGTIRGGREVVRREVGEPLSLGAGHPPRPPPSPACQDAGAPTGQGSGFLGQGSGEVGAAVHVQPLWAPPQGPLSLIRLWLSCFPHCVSNPLAPRLHPSPQLRKCLCLSHPRPGASAPILEPACWGAGPSWSPWRSPRPGSPPSPRSSLWGASALPTSQSSANVAPPTPPIRLRQPPCLF